MNVVTLIGRLTKAPELKFTNNSKAICNFTLAVNKKFKRDEPDFINCQCWEKTAEFVAKHFDKGSQIGVVGRLQVRNWDDQEGKKRYVTEVVVEETYFADTKKAGEESHDNRMDIKAGNEDICTECGELNSNCSCLPF